MSDSVKHRILLQPIGAEVFAPHGTPLRDLLFEQGVEFPCGGKGRCRGCKVRVLEGSVSVTDAQREHLTPEEIEAGWRLSCQCSLEDDLTIELRQWDAAILANDTEFTFAPQDGLGVAVDIGTTTLVAQLLDLSTSHVLAVRTALNPQARHGGDVMSRVEFAVADNGQAVLEQAIRREVGRLVSQLLAAAKSDKVLRRIVIVGNTVMHHLFSGVDVEPLSHVPFEPVDDGLHTFSPGDLGWETPGNPEVHVLPCLGGFVGSDVLAGILATGIAESDSVVGLVDLGTNGEIVIGNKNGMLCASTAAGPAFEGARISMGMRASTGAIWSVSRDDGSYSCEVLGNVTPRGLCGSGLVDAVAVGLDLKIIKPTGRLSDGADWALADPVVLTQTDIRQLQLAKGAIAAGVRILLRRLGVSAEELPRLYLAGAFGNYVNRTSALRIGLLDVPLERIQPSGNTALLGAKMALFSTGVAALSYDDLRRKVTHVSLSEDPEFQEIYVDEMSFPAA